MPDEVSLMREHWEEAGVWEERRPCLFGFHRRQGLRGRRREGGEWQNHRMVTQTLLGMSGRMISVPVSMSYIIDWLFATMKKYPM